LPCEGAFVAYDAFVARAEVLEVDYVKLAKEALAGIDGVQTIAPQTSTPATKASKATKGGRARDTVAQYEALATSPLVARVRAAWPWLGEHRPDLYEAVRDADDAGDVERLRAAMEEASRAYEQRQRAEAVRRYSRVLDTELWIAATEEAAAELRREGVTLPILLADEAMILGRMLKIDAREVFTVRARIQQAVPGARLRSVENKGHFNA
jgi:hypothetical protein